MKVNVAGRSNCKEFSSPRFTNGDVACAIGVRAWFIILYVMGRARGFILPVCPLPRVFSSLKGPTYCWCSTTVGLCSFCIAHAHTNNPFCFSLVIPLHPLPQHHFTYYKKKHILKLYLSPNVSVIFVLYPSQLKSGMSMNNWSTPC